MTNPFEDIQSIVAYRPQPGDVLFLLHPKILSKDAIAGIQNFMESAARGTALEGVKVIVLEEGMRPELVRALEGLTLDARQLERWRGDAEKQPPPVASSENRGEGGTQGGTPTPEGDA